MPTIRYTVILTASIPIEEKELFEKELHEIGRDLTETLNKQHPEANATIVWETKP